MGAPSKNSFALIKGIMHSTLQKYAQNVASKRSKIGGRFGKPSVVSSFNAEFAVHHTIRSDRSNEGLTAADVARALLQMQPELKTIQARNYIYHTFKVKSKGKIKHNSVIYQKTTSKISQCTVDQQHRWNTYFIAALTFLRKHNTGVCLKTGLSFMIARGQ